MVSNSHTELMTTAQWLGQHGLQERTPLPPPPGALSPHAFPAPPAPATIPKAACGSPI